MCDECNEIPLRKCYSSEDYLNCLEYIKGLLKSQKCNAKYTISVDTYHGSGGIRKG